MKISGQSDRLIEPKQIEKVEISVTTGARAGSQSKKINVTTNDRTNQTVQLECAANVLSALRCEPQDTVNLGALKRNAPEQTKTLTITRGDAGPLNPKVTSVANPQVKAELKEIEAGESYALVITASPPWPNGSLRTSVTLETGVEQEPTRGIQVFGTIAPRLQANPQRFMLRPTNTDEYDITVGLAWDDEPGKVLEASSTDPNLDVRIDGEGGKQALVMHVPVGYTPKKTFGEYVSIKTDDATVPTMQVPIYSNQQTTSAPAGPRNTTSIQAGPGPAAKATPHPQHAAAPAATQPAQP